MDPWWLTDLIMQDPGLLLTYGLRRNGILSGKYFQALVKSRQGSISERRKEE